MKAALHVLTIIVPVCACVCYVCVYLCCMCVCVMDMYIVCIYVSIYV